MLSIQIRKDEKHFLRQPGIEPRANAWKAFMLPLHHWREDGHFRQKCHLHPTLIWPNWTEILLADWVVLCVSVSLMGITPVYYLAWADVDTSI